MFDVGFSELVLISVIALVVLGPDRLPGAIRTLGLWIGRLRRSFNNIRSEIEREVGADEIRRQLRNEAIMEKIRNTRKEVVESLHSVKQEAESVKQDLSLDKEFKDLTGERPKPDTETPPPPPPPIPPAHQPAAESPERTGAAAEQAGTPVPPPAARPEPVPRAVPEAVPQPARQQDDPESK